MKVFRNTLYAVVAAAFAVALTVAQPAISKSPTQQVRAAQQAAPGIDDSDLLHLEGETRHFVDASCKIYVYVNTGIKYKGVSIVVKAYTCEQRRVNCHRGRPVYAKTVAVCVFSFELQPRLTKKGYPMFPGFKAQGCSGAEYFQKFFKDMKLHFKRLFIPGRGTTKCLNIDRA